MIPAEFLTRTFQTAPVFPECQWAQVTAPISALAATVIRARSTPLASAGQAELHPIDPGCFVAFVPFRRPSVWRRLAGSPMQLVAQPSRLMREQFTQGTDGATDDLFHETLPFEH